MDNPYSLFPNPCVILNIMNAKSNKKIATTTELVKDDIIQPQTEDGPAKVQPEVGGKQVGIKGRSIMKQFPKKKGKDTVFLVAGALVVVLAGVGTGWLLSGAASAEKSTTGPGSQVTVGEQKDAKEAGITDEETFRDSAEGVLVEEGIEGEGTHHLERGLGPEKDVYLTSTVIDLQSFVNKKVQVWGETISARKAGWLMDVGKIKVID